MSLPSLWIQLDRMHVRGTRTGSVVRWEEVM
jgi:hypothetical protein